MGPADPWSANWRPDPTGERLARIRTARRGAVLAVLAYVPVAIAVIATRGEVDTTTAVATAVALAVAGPGIALLGAGLAPAALGSRIDAVVAAIAFAVGAPVAAVTSFVIAGFMADAFIAVETSYALDVLRAAVLTAVGLAPLLAIVATFWVTAVRRTSQAGAQAVSGGVPSDGPDVDRSFDRSPTPDRRLVQREARRRNWIRRVFGRR